MGTFRACVRKGMPSPGIALAAGSMIVPSRPQSEHRVSEQGPAEAVERFLSPSGSRGLAPHPAGSVWRICPEQGNRVDLVSRAVTRHVTGLRCCGDLLLVQLGHRPRVQASSAQHQRGGGLQVASSESAVPCHLVDHKDSGHRPC